MNGFFNIPFVQAGVKTSSRFLNIAFGDDRVWPINIFRFMAGQYHAHVRATHLPGIADLPFRAWITGIKNAAISSHTDCSDRSAT